MPDMFLDFFLGVALLVIFREINPEWIFILLLTHVQVCVQVVTTLNDRPPATRIKKLSGSQYKLGASAVCPRFHFSQKIYCYIIIFCDTPGHRSGHAAFSTSADLTSDRRLLLLDIMPMESNETNRVPRGPCLPSDDIKRQRENQVIKAW